MAAYMIDFIKREDDINDDYYDDEERPRDLLASVEIEEVVECDNDNDTGDSPNASDASSDSD